METVTLSIEGFKLTVKEEFLKKVPGLLDDKNNVTMNMFDLMSKHELGKHLHNPSGPAIVEDSTGHCEYWLNGNQLDGEAAEKIKHNCNFHDKFMKDLE